MRFLLRRLGPWGWVLLAIEAALTVRRHWQRTSTADRARLQALVRQSRGRPGNLTADQRSEFRELGRRLRLGTLARDLLTGVVRARRARRR